MNKLTIEEQFLTSEQAKELQKLGVDFSGANFCLHLSKDLFIGRSTNFFPYSNTFKDTLSVAEMIEMLPEYTSIEHYTGKWHISDNHNSLYPHFERNVLLRDALFEMLKWLKQNKLI